MDQDFAWARLGRLELHDLGGNFAWLIIDCGLVRSWDLNFCSCHCAGYLDEIDSRGGKESTEKWEKVER